jgi:hypothetical protein
MSHGERQTGGIREYSDPCFHQSHIECLHGNLDYRYGISNHFHDFLQQIRQLIIVVD